ncbi:MAG: formate dehydrogenase accessory sulfurtransferase FdhD [Saprospiraceae bacterium]|nr:formate dehydrogenase accessory sulfurtransferase FdhD [Saprospiraceae bacterium]
MVDRIPEKVQIKEVSVFKNRNGTLLQMNDQVAVESPLQMEINGKPISVTMRTPGDDPALTVGFLFTEGIIHDYDQVACVIQTDENSINVKMEEDIDLPTTDIARNFYTTSSCGVCGKSSVESIVTKSLFTLSGKKIFITDDVLFSLQEKLLTVQSAFESTGGLHASALFHPDGKYLYHSEDVGRHNALDKLIGHALMAGRMPLSNHILMLSGRASFELVQKAGMAGIPVIVSVGAPSSLAVELAQSSGHILIGFLKRTGYNIYAGKDLLQSD